MEFKHNEKIEFIESYKNAGFLVVPNHDPENYVDSLDKFFGGFGKKLLIGGNNNYLLFCLAPDHQNRLDAFSYIENGDDFLFIEGTFYDKSYHQNKNRGLINRDIAKRIYDDVKHKKDCSLLKDINGHYSGVACINNDLLGFNDRFGVHNLFCYHHDETFILTNNLFSIINNHHLKIDIDLEAIAQILAIEFPFKRKTGFKNVEYVLPSEILVKKNHTIEFVKRFIAFNRHEGKSKTFHLEALREAVNRFFATLKGVIEEPVGIYLSKGKDSRLFIDYLEKHNFNFSLFTFLQSTGIFDYPYTIKIAELLGKDIHLLEHYQIDDMTETLAGMSTTLTSPWMALAYVIQKNKLNYGLIGTLRRSLGRQVNDI